MKIDSLDILLEEELKDLYSAEKQGDKYARPNSTRGPIGDRPLRADHRSLFMLCRAARA